MHTERSSTSSRRSNGATQSVCCRPRSAPLWRAKQLEYTWTLQAMGEYHDFWKVTGDSLDYAIAATGASGSHRRRSAMRFCDLDPFPEVLDVLQALRAHGMRLAVLSNGTTRMLTRALDAAGVSPSLDHVISVDEISTYKPDLRVYRYAVERLGVETSQIRFVSANAWDAAGARLDRPRNLLDQPTGPAIGVRTR